MNQKKLAEALNTISMGFAEAAEALMEQPVAATALPPAPSASAAPAATSPVERSPFEDETATWEAPDNLPTQDEGSEAVCPKHKKPYLPSKFKEGAFYCPADSDDPAWRNSKGKCRITPVNAAQYLRIQAAA